MAQRGTKGNRHPGNKRYLEEVKKLTAEYRSSRSTQHKQSVSQALVDRVKAYGGRFVTKDDKTNQWYIMTDAAARNKAGQALREDNTAENRKNKRDKYPNKPKSETASAKVEQQPAATKQVAQGTGIEPEDLA